MNIKYVYQNDFLLFTPKSPKEDFLGVLLKSPLGDLGVNYNVNYFLTCTYDNFRQ